MKPITLKEQPSKGYVFNGAQVLVDGLHGGSNYKTGHWLGFQGKDLDATIDLKEPTEIQKVSFNTNVVKGDWIMGASAVTVKTKITLILMDEQEREYTYPYPVVAVDIEEMGGDRTAVFKTSEPISDTDVAEIHNAFYGTDLEFEIEKELGITWVESINYEDGSVITPEMARKEQLLYASTDKYGIYQLKPNLELDSLRF
mgnify:CR=1 FL=1